MKLPDWTKALIGGVVALMFLTGIATGVTGLTVVAASITVGVAIYVIIHNEEEE